MATAYRNYYTVGQFRLGVSVKGARNSKQKYNSVAFLSENAFHFNSQCSNTCAGPENDNSDFVSRVLQHGFI
jgi:hypothetical protein